MKESVARFIESGPVDEELCGAFAQDLYYEAGHFDDPAFYTRLAARLAGIAQARHTGGNVLFYLSAQPSFYPATVEL